MNQVSSNDTFDREAYKTQKREEKDRIFEMLSEETQKLLNPEKLKAYADVQAKFLRSSVSNALLIGRQRPEATWIRSFDDWKNDNICPGRGASGKNRESGGSQCVSRGEALPAGSSGRGFRAHCPFFRRPQGKRCTP